MSKMNPRNKRIAESSQPTDTAATPVTNGTVNAIVAFFTAFYKRLFVAIIVAIVFICINMILANIVEIPDWLKIIVNLITIAAMMTSVLAGPANWKRHCAIFVTGIVILIFYGGINFLEENRTGDKKPVIQKIYNSVIGVMATPTPAQASVTKTWKTTLAPKEFTGNGMKWKQWIQTVEFGKDKDFVNGDIVTVYGNDFLVDTKGEWKGPTNGKLDIKIENCGPGHVLVKSPKGKTFRVGVKKLL